LARTADQRERKEKASDQTAETSGENAILTADAQPSPALEVVEAVPGRAKDESAKLDATANAVGGATVAGASGLMKESKFASKASAQVTPRWTLTSDGTLQRSLDAGKTWEAIPVAANVVFRALAAFGVHIWVGGSAGALYHSSDAGQHWVQVTPSADGEPLTAEIIGVEFTDAQHGKITTARETWTTSDAGQSWQKK
jgi:photosystem II stability/assembly factor-like uncharacterized protein